MWGAAWPTHSYSQHKLTVEALWNARPSMHGESKKYLPASVHDERAYLKGLHVAFCVIEVKGQGLHWWPQCNPPIPAVGYAI